MKRVVLAARLRDLYSIAEPTELRNYGTCGTLLNLWILRTCEPAEPIAIGIVVVMVSICYLVLFGSHLHNSDLQFTI